MYGTVDGFKNHHTTRGKPVSEYTDEIIAASLTVASEWLDARYRNMFPGVKTGDRTQISEWPRTGGVDIHGNAIPSDVPPNEVIKAAYEAAFFQLTSPGILSVNYTPSKYKRVAISGAVSAEYRDYSSASEIQTRFQIIDDTLAVILTGGGKSARSTLSGGSVRV